MATETLRPNADSISELSAYPGAGDNYEEVDEEVADEDSTHVYVENEGEEASEEDEYSVNNSVIGAGTITNVRVYARCKGVTPE